MTVIQPLFGASGVNSIGREASADAIELQDGFQRYIFKRGESGSFTITQEEIGSNTVAWGIEDNATNPFEAVISTATLTETEVVLTHEDFATGALITINTDFSTTQSGKLVGFDKVLLLRLERRLSLSGVGSLPDSTAPIDLTSANVGDLGSIYAGMTSAAADINPVIGASITLGSATSITFPVSAGKEMMTRTSKGSSNTDFNRWDVEFVEYIPALITADLSDVTKHVISGYNWAGMVCSAIDQLGTAAGASSGITSDLQSANFCSATRTLTLNAEGFASESWTFTPYYAPTESPSWT